jgi:hypothetical protein
MNIIKTKWRYVMSEIIDVIKEKLRNIIEEAWDNGIKDYASRTSDFERAILLGCCGDEKIENDVPSLLEQLLSIRLNDKLEPDPEGRYGIAIVDREYVKFLAEIAPSKANEIWELGFVKEIKGEERWVKNINL